MLLLYGWHVPFPLAESCQMQMAEVARESCLELLSAPELEEDLRVKEEGFEPVWRQWPLLGGASGSRSAVSPVTTEQSLVTRADSPHSCA